MQDGILRHCDRCTPNHPSFNINFGGRLFQQFGIAGSYQHNFLWSHQRPPLSSHNQNPQSPLHLQPHLPAMSTIHTLLHAAPFLRTLTLSSTPSCTNSVTCPLKLLGAISALAAHTNFRSTTRDRPLGAKAPRRQEENAMRTTSLMPLMEPQPPIYHNSANTPPSTPRATTIPAGHLPRLLPRVQHHHHHLLPTTLPPPYLLFSEKKLGYF